MNRLMHQAVSPRLRCSLPLLALKTPRVPILQLCGPRGERLKRGQIFPNDEDRVYDSINSYASRLMLATSPKPPPVSEDTLHFMVVKGTYGKTYRPCSHCKGTHMIEGTPLASHGSRKNPTWLPLVGPLLGMWWRSRRPAGK